MDNILKVLMDIGRQKAVLLSSGIPGANVIIRNDLVAMHKESTELSDALINAAPVSNPFTRLEQRGFSLIMVTYLGRSQEQGYAIEKCC